MLVGNKIRFTKDIYYDGMEHHPPGFIGLKGDLVLVKQVHSTSLSVAHEDVTDGSSFVVFDGEYEYVN